MSRTSRPRPTVRSAIPAVNRSCPGCGLLQLHAVQSAPRPPLLKKPDDITGPPRIRGVGGAASRRRSRHGTVGERPGRAMTLLRSLRRRATRTVPACGARDLDHAFVQHLRPRHDEAGVGARADGWRSPPRSTSSSGRSDTPTNRHRAASVHPMTDAMVRAGSPGRQPPTQVYSFTGAPRRGRGPLPVLASTACGARAGIAPDNQIVRFTS